MSSLTIQEVYQHLGISDQPPPMLVLKVQAPLSVDSWRHEEALLKLLTIFEAYEDCDDLLSKRLFRWGFEVIALDCPQVLDAESIAYVAKKINALVTEILLCDLVRVPLTDPYLFDGLVWEKRFLDDFLAIWQTLCGIGTKPMAPDPQGHAFAKEIIEWVSTLPNISSANAVHPPSSYNEIVEFKLPKPAGSSLIAFMPPQASLKLSPAEKMLIYQNLIQNRMRINALEEGVIQPLSNLSAKLEKCWRDTRKWIKAQANRTRQETAQFANEIHGQLVRIDATHQQERGLLADKIAGLQSSLMYLSNDYGSLERHKDELLLQLAKLQEAYQCLNAEVQDLRNQDSGGCIIL